MSCLYSTDSHNLLLPPSLLLTPPEKKESTSFPPCFHGTKERKLLPSLPPSLPPSIPRPPRLLHLHIRVKSGRLHLILPPQAIQPHLAPLQEVSHPSLPPCLGLPPSREDLDSLHATHGGSNTEPGASALGGLVLSGRLGREGGREG